MRPTIREEGVRYNYSREIKQQKNSHYAEPAQELDSNHITLHLTPVSLVRAWLQNPRASPLWALQQMQKHLCQVAGHQKQISWYLQGTGGILPQKSKAPRLAWKQVHHEKQPWTG